MIHNYSTALLGAIVQNAIDAADIKCYCGDVGVVIIIRLVNNFGNYALWVLPLSQQSFCSGCCHTVQLVVFAFWNKTPHLHGQRSGSSGKRQQNVGHSVKKTSEGTACSSITDTQHVFGWSLHPPDFVTVSKTAKSVSYCNYLIGGGKEEEKNIVQRCRLEVLISYQTCLPLFSSQCQCIFNADTVA